MLTTWLGSSLLVCFPAVAAEPVKIRASRAAHWTPLLPEKPELMKNNGKIYVYASVQDAAPRLKQEKQ